VLTARRPRVLRFGRLALIMIMLLLGATTAGTAQAEDDAVKPNDSIPGSTRPPGLGLSPEAPPVPPAPGGRAPSFGAPTEKEEWAFRIGGRFSGWESVGIGRRPDNAPTGYDGTPLHVPARTLGRQPFWSGAGATLSLQYGNSIVSSTVVFYARFSGKERQGYYTPQNGPSVGQAYLTVRPEPLGRLRLHFKAGAFAENYAGPGQWGWGIYGPMLAIRGYGETANAEYDINPNWRLYLTHGFMGVPGVPESFVRGEYNSWIETGISTFVHHAHAGLSFKNQYFLKLHYASAYGTDERTYLPTFLGSRARDGRLDTYIVETRWLGDPYGQIGVSGAYWNFAHAASVGDGIWWGIDWTQGARELINKFLGPTSQGHGELAAVSAEYDMSVSRILAYPRTFDGRSRDLRVAVAGLRYWTLASRDPFYADRAGYYAGTQLEYVAFSWLSATFQAYVESRHTTFGQWMASSLSPGIAFHSDWLSTDRIMLAYTRNFYSDVVDNNSALKLDRDVVTLGAYITF
jgi:hypothetical protein